MNFSINILIECMLPLDASIPTVGCPQVVHQRRGGLTLTVARDGLDLVGVHNMWRHVPAQREAKITVSPHISG